jgi:hypothetical protein
MPAISSKRDIAPSEVLEMAKGHAFPMILARSAGESDYFSRLLDMQISGRNPPKGVAF